MSYIPVATRKFQISHRYGQSYSWGGVDHSTDYAVPVGTGVISTIAGTVEYAGFKTRADGSPSYGNLIIVRDKQGNRHYFAHLSGFGVKPGQRITAGQFIGRSGASGRTTGPHLAYEVRDARGGHVDPARFTGDQISNASGDVFANPTGSFERQQRHFRVARSLSSLLGSGESIAAAVLDIGQSALDALDEDAQFLAETELPEVPQRYSRLQEIS